VTLVLDSSVTLAWAYAEETTEAIRQVFNLVLVHGAWVPGIWRLEIGNVLEMGIRRGRHTTGFRDELLADLATLPIRLDPDTDRHAWAATVQLATRHRLTTYGACYLELAQRLRVPLATLDSPLRAAATAEHVALRGV
jgi:predicted nucleic acid-binding protein